MRRQDVDEVLQNASFEFFYWFSRFEFALKENGYLKNVNAGANAEANWKQFTNHFESDYELSAEAKKLIELHPKRQIVGNSKTLEWKPVGLDHCPNGSGLCAIITMLCTIRNNLFHGGKHGDVCIDSRGRNLELLSISRTVLDQLVEEAGLDSDYYRLY